MSPTKIPTSAAITILVEIVCEIYSIAIMSINAIADAITAAIIADCTEIWKKYKPVTTAEVIINKKRNCYHGCTDSFVYIKIKF